MNIEIIETMEDIEQGVEALIALEPRFQHAVEIAGLPPLRRSEGGFCDLLEMIASQQVSVASANALCKRLKEGGATSQEAVAEMDVETLRGLGLSRQKASYALALADAKLPFDQFHHMHDHEIIEKMVAVKGIGQWTAEIYLMFALGRRDVFAAGDLALQESARLLFELDERPRPKELAKRAENWSPWRAIAARQLWAYFRAIKNREGIQ